MNWLYYLAEANIYLGVFYLAYCLFLTKETYYQLTRVYLLFACVASFALPVLQIGALKPVEAAIATTVNYTLPEYTAPQGFTPIITAPVVIEHHLTVDDYLMYIYFIGAGIVFLMLMVKLFTLFKLVANAKRIERDKHKLVYLPQTNVAFSFFNYLFIGAEAEGANTIIRHELVHIRQKHSVDIVFLELLKVVSWFNPFIYLLQNSLKTVHEYIADEQTAAYETDALTYSSFLVNNAYGAGGSSITHSFFNYNLLKKRIVMLNQKRSGNLARLKYLVTIPLCAGLLCVSTLAFSKTYGWVDIDPANAIDEKIVSTLVSPEKNTKIESADIPETANFKQPPPSLVDDNYKALGSHLLLTLRNKSYQTFSKSGLVVASFTVNGNHHISGLKVSKSAGKDMDNTAINAFRSFTGTVNDKPGEHSFLVNFYKNDNTPGDAEFIEDKDHKYKGRLVIEMGHPFHSFFLDKTIPRPMFKDPNTKRTTAFLPFGNKLVIVEGKVYKPKLDEQIISDSLEYIPANNAAAIKKWGDKAKNGMVKFTGNVTIQPNKNSKFPPPIVKRDQVKFPPPGVKRDQVKFPPPIVKPDAKTSIVKPDTVSKTDVTSFYKDLSNNIRYPAADRDKGIVGRAVVQFYVDNNKNIQYIKVIRSPSDNLSQEIIRVLKNSPYLKAFKGGTWSLPVAFTMNGGFEATQGGSAMVYNPNGFNIPGIVQPTGYLNEVVIRGYTSEQATPVQTTNTIEKPDLEKLGLYFSRNIKYPAADRQETIGGRVITLFSVDAGHNLQYAKVVRTPSAAMGDEVIRVLKKCTDFDALKPGVQYVLRVAFTLGYEDSSTGIEIEPKSRSIGSPAVYNPNSVDIPNNAPGSLILNDVVIRGYIKKPATPGKTSGDVIQRDLSEFKRYFVNAVEYPAELGKQGVGGTVMTNFSINNNHKVGSIKVMLSPSDRLSNEVINALKAMPAMAAMKPGDTYQFPVYFTPPSGVPLKKSTLTNGSPIAYNSSSAIPPSGNLIGIPGISFRSY